MTNQPAPTDSTNTPPVPAPVPAPKESFTKQEYETALEKVRQDEKTKLYAEVTSSKERAEKLAEQVEALTKESQTLRTSLDSIKASKGANGDIDVQKLVEEVAARASKTVSANAQTKIDELSSQVSKLQGEINVTRSRELRDRLIAEAGGPDAIIPELVKGNTEDELRASITLSKTIFDSTKARLLTPTTNTPAPIQQTPAGGVPPMAPPPIDTGSNTLRAIDPTTSSPRIKPSDWKAIRAEQLQAAQGRYPSR